MIIKHFPKLFKQGGRGQIQEWSIEARRLDDATAEYIVSHGQMGGIIQTTTTKVSGGKNLGRKNATDAWTQACADSQSKWNKQLDKGYVESLGHWELNEAKLYLPMLAKSFKDYGHKIKFPCFVQPKLDGIRCVAHKIQVTGQIKLLSRKGKEFGVLGHIEQELRHIFMGLRDGTCLDGELYTHGENFQDIISAVKRDEVSDLSGTVEYHIYDVFNHNYPEKTFAERHGYLCSHIGYGYKFIKLVSTETVVNVTDIPYWFKTARDAGYEGMMLRNIHGLYQNDKRSEHLQKFKEFLDEEFEIVGGEEGKGKFSGMCIFRCKTKDGKEFAAMPMGTEYDRRKYLTDLPKLIGKMLTVRFFEYSKDGVPRFPVGVVIRDYE
jgi:ATP-dependent DNA ligase